MFLEHERGCENYLLSRVDKKWETVNRERKEWKWEQTFIYTGLTYVFLLPIHFFVPIFHFSLSVPRFLFPVP